MRETFLLINCDLGKEQQIVESLETLQDVQEVQVTYGVYDIVAKIQTKTEKELNKTIRLKIMSLRPVQSVLALKTDSDAHITTTQ
ncbi:MAG: Lrp/AsnC ligand binding domain-containing protein [Thaumarchaeota archaeon]|nr:Lrp/AsnC ligand binding domain-containing protein [Nitrososphaerota archaeon]MDE1817012.1 Lrp/AsnC ligand binding domain-containing protein [Nitrososphaerota archaeon]MDE1876243.1 Lrp/AsnC ligand binding domain-containing protein [Nitrososphaerota archaeon]